MNEESSMMQEYHVAFLLIFLQEKRGLVTEVNRKGKAKIISLKCNLLEMISLFVGVGFPHLRQITLSYDADGMLL